MRAVVEYPQCNFSLCALLLLKNVNVVDIDSGAIVAGRSVVVSEGYIKEIGAQETVRAPAGARVIDGSGRYLMPALWDMHTHPMEPEALSMLARAPRGSQRRRSARLLPATNRRLQVAGAVPHRQRAVAAQSERQVRQRHGARWRPRRGLLGTRTEPATPQLEHTGSRYSLRGPGVMLRASHLFAVSACAAVTLLGASAHALTTPQLLRLDTGRSDQGHAIAADAVGNVYVAASIGADSQRADFAVIKYDSRGSRAWTARYSGSINGQIGRALAVTADSSGNVYATGSVMTVVAGVTRGTDLLVVRFSPDGIRAVVASGRSWHRLADCIGPRL